MRRVVVTGLGIICPIGNDKESVVRSLREGRSGIEFCQEYRDRGLRSQIHGSLKIAIDEAIETFRNVLDTRYQLAHDRGFDFSLNYRVSNMLARTLFERAQLERGDERREKRNSFIAEAIAWYHHTLGIEPENAEAHYGLSQAYAQSGETGLLEEHRRLYQTYKVNDNARDRAIALARRMDAMARDGQVIKNRKGLYCLTGHLPVSTGRVHGHPDGFGFLIPDSEGARDIYLSAREMRQVMHGDRVAVRVRGKIFAPVPTWPSYSRRWTGHLRKMRRKPLDWATCSFICVTSRNRSWRSSTGTSWRAGADWRPRVIWCWRTKTLSLDTRKYSAVSYRPWSWPC